MNECWMYLHVIFIGGCFAVLRLIHFDLILYIYILKYSDQWSSIEHIALQWLMINAMTVC